MNKTYEVLYAHFNDTDKYNIRELTHMLCFFFLMVGSSLVILNLLTGNKVSLSLSIIATTICTAYISVKLYFQW